MPYRRRVFRRLDHLVIGASPKKLEQAEIPAATPRAAVPLSDKEKLRLRELSTKRIYAGPLTPEEHYEREQLRVRMAAEGGR